MITLLDVLIRRDRRVIVAGVSGLILCACIGWSTRTGWAPTTRSRIT